MCARNFGKIFIEIYQDFEEKDKKMQRKNITQKIKLTLLNFNLKRCFVFAFTKYIFFSLSISETEYLIHASTFPTQT